MATERQIQANRANAAKSTGPRTPEGKRISSQNARRDGGDLHAVSVLLRGEAVHRFQEISDALMNQFQPRNPLEVSLVQNMVAARWRLLRLWGMQSADFQLEMERTADSHPSLPTGAVLASIAYRKLADNSRVQALQLRQELAYDRQYHRNLALLLKLQQSPSTSVPTQACANLFTTTWDDRAAASENKPNPSPSPAHNPECNEQLPEPPPRVPVSKTNPQRKPGDQYTPTPGIPPHLVSKDDGAPVQENPSEP
ncbi:MAG TPA: hypothetical protein VGN17_30645 [Bryobacteraceae bacterium]